MEECLEGLHDDVGVAYLENAVVYCEDFNNHTADIQKVLRMLPENGTKLKSSNCESL